MLPLQAAAVVPGASLVSEPNWGDDDEEALAVLQSRGADEKIDVYRSMLVVDLNRQTHGGAKTVRAV